MEVDQQTPPSQFNNFCGLFQQNLLGVFFARRFNTCSDEKCLKFVRRKNLKNDAIKKLRQVCDCDFAQKFSRISNKNIGGARQLSFFYPSVISHKKLLMPTTK